MNRKQRRRQEKKQTRAQARSVPDTVDGLLAAAGERFAQGRCEDALRLCVRAREMAPGTLAVETNLGNVLARMGRDADAAEAYGRALAADPNAVPVLANLAILKAETGAAGDAIALYRRILEIDPLDAETYHDLALLKTFAAGDGDLKAMERLRADPGIARERAMFLDFALAKALDDAGDFEAAFRHLAAANRAKRASLDYAVERDEAMARRVIATFTPGLAARPGGAPGETPVLVVGMPRSGTTLVEQVLASHSAVFGAGEVNHLRDVVLGLGDAGPGVRGLDEAGRDFPEGAAGVPAKGLAAMGRAYLERLGRESPDARRITDKMPRNFFFLGLVAMILPGARVVHCRRDPAATCFSCYQIHFPDGQEFTYDLAELGRYYRLYDRLMAHWRDVLGARMHEIRYEDLVAKPETEMRRLLDFLGLGWEDACLDFHTSGRRVATASTQQVRRPIYRSAVARWKPYEKHLAPLLDALGPLAAGD